MTDDYADNDSDSEGCSGSAEAEVRIIKISLGSHVISHISGITHEFAKLLLIPEFCFV